MDANPSIGVEGRGLEGSGLGNLGRSLVAQLAYRSGALELVDWVSQAWRGGRRRVLVLAYHRVVDDFGHEARCSMPSRLISRGTFARHLELLRQDYDVVSLSEAVRHMCGPEKPVLARGRRPRRPLAAITFDDGYEEVHRNAFPVLRQFGFPFTVFVVSGYAGTERRLPHDRLHHQLLKLLQLRASSQGQAPVLSAGLEASLSQAGLPLPTAGEPTVQPGEGRAPWVDSLRAASAVARLQAALSLAEVEELIAELRTVTGASDEPAGGRMLDWDQVVDLAQQGASIGAQTVEHAILSHEPHARVVKELCDSRADLELRLDRDVASFAYPEGRHHPGVVETVARAGFSLAVTTADGRGGPGTSPLLVPRKTVWEMTSHGLLGPSRAVLATELAHHPGQGDRR